MVAKNDNNKAIKKHFLKENFKQLMLDANGKDTTNRNTDDTRGIRRKVTVGNAFLTKQERMKLSKKNTESKNGR